MLLELPHLRRELALLVAQRGGLLELLVLDRSYLLLADALDLVLELAVPRRSGHRLDAQPRGGLVDQVDRLVGQVPVLDVAVGELGRGLERVVGDRDAVMRLVAVAQAAQDLHRVVDGGLLDTHLLEAALESGVALEVLAVLVERRGADRLQLAARQRRLEDRGRVDRALGRARADEVVQLVDEQDDVAAQHRIVLLAAREDLHDALDLGLAADDRIELALLRLLREVAAELVEQLRGLRLLARRAARAGLTAAGPREHPDDLVADLLGVG